MRIAVFSDLHANRQAWRAVHADMLEQGVESMVCLGDIVGYGPEPQEVLDAVRAATGDIVLGNHDAVIGGLMDSADFNDHARDIIEWTRGQLDADAAAFCGQLPESIEANGVLYTHAEAAEPLRFGYIDTPEEALESFRARPETLIFIGHTHVPCVFAQNVETGEVARRTHHRLHLRPHERHLVNVGSVGEPRDGDPRSSYVIFDDEARSLEFRRVAFDVEAYLADLARRGLNIEPAFLAAHRYQQEHPGEAMGSVVQVVRAQPAMKKNAQPAVLPARTGPKKTVIRLGAKRSIPAAVPTGMAQAQGAAIASPRATPPVPPKSRIVPIVVLSTLLLGGGLGAWSLRKPTVPPPALPTVPAPGPEVASPAEEPAEAVAPNTKVLTAYDAKPGTVWLVRFGRAENKPADERVHWNNMSDYHMPAKDHQRFWRATDNGRSLTATVTDVQGPMVTDKGGVTKQNPAFFGFKAPPEATQGSWSSNGAAASLTWKLSGLNPYADYLFLPLLNGARADSGAVRSWSVQGAGGKGSSYLAEKVEGFDLSNPIRPSAGGTIHLILQFGAGAGSSGINALAIKELTATAGSK